MNEHRCEHCGARLRPRDGKVCPTCIHLIKAMLAAARKITDEGR